MLCQSLFFNKASGLKPFFQVWEHPFHKTPLGDCFWFLQSILYRSCVFVKENWNILYIWYKAFSFIIFDNYQLKIILNRKVPSFLKVAANFVPSINFHVSVCSRDVFYIKWKETSVNQWETFPCQTPLMSSVGRYQ